MSGNLKNSQEESINDEIKCAETSIKLIDEILKHGTLNKR